MKFALMTVTLAVLGTVSAAHAQPTAEPGPGAKPELRHPVPHPPGPEKMGSLFERMDQNKDGVVDRKEFQEAHERMREKAREARERGPSQRKPGPDEPGFKEPEPRPPHGRPARDGAPEFAKP